MSTAPKARKPHSSMPIHASHTARCTHARHESGGIVSERRRHGVISSARPVCDDVLISSARNVVQGSGCHRLFLRASERSICSERSSIVMTVFSPRLPQGGGSPSPTRIVTTGKGGASAGHSVWQSVTMISRSIGPLFLSTNHCRPLAISVPPPPSSCNCDRIEDLPDAVDGGVTTRHDHFARVSELPRQCAQLGHRPGQLRILHRAGCVDQESRAGPRLVERRHDELAVTGLPPMRLSIRPIVAAERALPKRDADGPANDRHVVDLRRHHTVRPTAPAQRDFAGKAGDIHDALRDVAPHHLCFHGIDTWCAARALFIGRQLPWPSIAMGARAAIALVFRRPAAGFESSL